MCNMYQQQGETLPVTDLAFSLTGYLEIHALWQFHPDSYNTVRETYLNMC